MRTLNNILTGVAVKQVLGSTEVVVNALQIDSRKVDTGDCFVAIKGTSNDGHDYISTCIEKGACVIVCENLPKEISTLITYVLVADSSITLGLMAANYYEHPSEKMKVVGVTGTNGKTSTVTLLFRLFRAMDYQVGLLSTVQNQINEDVIPATHTTPDAISLQQLLKQMADAGCSYCFMEVSSHAVYQNRISGIHFAGAIFTNITHDHLDYHKTFANYLNAKKKFFDELPTECFALSNADDRNGSVVLQNTKAKSHFYSFNSVAEFKGKILENTLQGLVLNIDGQECYTKLIGEFNGYNLLAVYATAILLGMEKIETLRILSALAPPDGRFEQLISPQEKIIGIVDYAHTPDALKNVLQTICATKNGNENLISVIGCGGDRDTSKRPLMAQIATHFSTKVILTSDNPRSEDPNEIIQQMYAGVPAPERKKVLSITDRREAIKSACMLAERRDIILIAGKGHEKYQEVKGIKTPFDDKAILTELFTELDK